jgi:hypothetical protein
MILRKVRDECLQARSRKIKKLIVRLRDSSEIDFAPLIGRVVQKKVFDRYLGLEVLDYAIELISSAAFPFESDWNVTLANVSLGGIISERCRLREQALKAVRDLVEDCLEEVEEKDKEEKAHEQVTGTSKGETPRRTLITKLAPDKGLPYIPVPADMTFDSAKLRHFTKGPSEGSTISGHRMFASWDDSSAWNEFGPDGGELDGVMAEIAPSFSFFAPIFDEFVTVDVTTEYLDWLAGADNKEFVLVTDSSDGWDFWSAEFEGDPELKPTLILSYRASCD